MGSGLWAPFDLLGGGLGVPAGDLVKLLPIAAALYGRHQNFLGHHERQLAHHRYNL